MKKFKNVMAGALAAVVAATPYAVLADTAAIADIAAAPVITEADYDIYINGTQLEGTKEYLSDETVMIPLRTVCETLGMEVTWDGETETITIEKLPVYITCSPNSDGYTFAKTAPMSLGVMPALIDDRTYVPLSFVNEVLQGEASVEENRIDISYGEEEAVQEESVYSDVICISKADSTLTVYDAVLGIVELNITEETKLTDITPEDIAAGQELSVVYSPAMTLSLPPMASAVEIAAKEEASFAVLEGSIVAVEKDEDGNIIQITIGEEDVMTQTVLNISETTSFLDTDSTLADSSIITDETKKISVVASTATTRSIPPQTAAYVITVIE